jgi:hypothetical protein
MRTTSISYSSKQIISIITLVVLFAITGTAVADTLKVTLVARKCPNYSDVMANMARNNIMESLEDLGPNSNYSSGQSVAVAKELAVVTQRDNCTPLNDWIFAVGDRISGTKDTGVYGTLSKVARKLRDAGPTRNNVPLLDKDGRNTGEQIDGAVTINLNNSERDLVAQRRLTIQGGVPGNPLNGSTILGFATLRCGVDNKNADNVEYADFPSGAEHILCYGYYVEPAPYAGTIIIKKKIVGTPPAGSDATFSFGGNVSYNANGAFTIKNSGSITFIRAGLTGGDPTWNVFEDLTTLPAGYKFTSVSCSVSGNAGSTTVVNNELVNITLKASDTVTCEYVNTYSTPLSQLSISPILECTARNAASSYEAYFGYLSRESTTVSVPVGSFNQFTPAPANRGQPYTFLSGRHSRVFSVETNGSNLVWSLTGRTATSSSSPAQRCSPTCIVPTAENPAQCDPSIVIDGTRSGTLNNNGNLSSYTWQTDCPGTLQNTNTLTPTLTFNYSQVPASGTTCSVSLTVKDDTSYGGSTAGEVQTRTCSTKVTVGNCAVDCAGIPNGNTQVDECGVCGGNGSTCLDCAGTPNGGQQVDQCGVCGGDNSACADCAGIPNGSAVVDSCGICGGDGSSCTGLPSGCNGSFDSCGVCNGDNSTCLDCAGLPNGGTTVDNCGVCGGDGSSCGNCIVKPPVSASQKKQVRATLVNLSSLTKTAIKYSKEAIACNPKGSKQLEDDIAALGKQLNATKDSLQGSYIEDDTLCSNGDCHQISIIGLKAELKKIIQSISKISIEAQNIVAGCRRPIKSNTKGISTRARTKLILDKLAAFPDSVISCTGDPS